MSESSLVWYVVPWSSAGSRAGPYLTWLQTDGTKLRAMDWYLAALSHHESGRPDWFSEHRELSKLRCNSRSMAPLELGRWGVASA